MLFYGSAAILNTVQYLKYAEPSQLQGMKIHVLDLGMFAGQHGMAPCDIDSTFRVDPITNVPFLHDDPQVTLPPHAIPRMLQRTGLAAYGLGQLLS